MVFKGRLKFDARGRFSLNAGVSTGSHFISGYDNTSLGAKRGGFNPALRHLYLSAKPFSGVEAQVGSLYLNRGEATESTTYDNDGFITGYRLSVRRPKQFFFDEVAVTYAHLGDVDVPNVNKRFHRLKKSNYHQFLFAKSLGKRAAVSADYTFHAGIETLREAARINTKELKAVDSIRLELYQRLDVKRDSGFSLQAEKTLRKRLTLGGGFAAIDRQFGSLGADRFGTGKRIFAFGSYAFRPELKLQVFATRAVANDFSVSNRNRFDVLLSYDLLKSLQKTGLF